MFLWTDERVELLIGLWSDGLSAGQIANKFGGITRSAVLGKVHRLRLARALSITIPRRGNTAKRVGAESRKRARRRGRVLSEELVAQRAAQRAVALAREANQAGPDLDIPPSERRRILVPDDHGKLHANDALDGSVCRWPMGDPQSADFGFCPHNAHPGLPYCEFHAKRAYTAVIPVARDPVMQEVDRQRRDVAAKVKTARMHLQMGSHFSDMKAVRAAKIKELV